MTDIVRPLQSFGKEADVAGQGSECETSWSAEQAKKLVSGYGPLTGAFFVSYTIWVYIVLLNVTVSVLLEGTLLPAYPSAYAHDSWHAYNHDEAGPDFLSRW